MAVTFIEERKKQKKLIWALLLVILITLFVLSLGFFRKAPRPAIEVKEPGHKEIKINFQVLEKPILKELQPFEKISFFEQEIGRENPFLPY